MKDTIYRQNSFPTYIQSEINNCNGMQISSEEKHSDFHKTVGNCTEHVYMQ